jgi:hypothetical protein
MHKYIEENVYIYNWWRGSSLSKCILNTQLPKDYIPIEISLDNYDWLTNPMENVQNMRSSLELVIQYHDSICKLLLTTFRGSVLAWYNLEPNSIEGFSNLYAKLMTHFSTNIHAKKNST